MMQIIKPNSLNQVDEHKVSVFLAGSIEMGTAEDWQTKVQEALKDLDITIYNPRRDDWDSSWVQSKDNEQFRAQVEWELHKLYNADIILMYFSPETKSPISLLELGLFSKKNMIVVCPEGFWRKGNVDIVCETYDIAQADSIESAIEMIKTSHSHYMNVMEDALNTFNKRYIKSYVD
jgi:hypothetical protein